MQSHSVEERERELKWPPARRAETTNVNPLRCMGLNAKFIFATAFRKSYGNWLRKYLFNTPISCKPTKKSTRLRGTAGSWGTKRGMTALILFMMRSATSSRSSSDMDARVG